MEKNTAIHVHSGDSDSSPAPGDSHFNEKKQIISDVDDLSLGEVDGHVFEGIHDDSEQVGIPNSWDEEKVNAYYKSLSDEEVDYLMEKTGHGSTLEDHDTLTSDLKYILYKCLNMSDERALAIFKYTMEEHLEDVNFPTGDWAFMEEAVGGTSDYQTNSFTNFKLKLTATLIYYHSPYAEVRAVTDAVDEDVEPVETIRSYVLGTIFLILAAGVNEFFSHRQPSISLPTAVLSILLYPSGKLWERIMPKVDIPWFGGKKIPLNPGKYTYKEQMFATVMVGVSSTSVYVSYNIVTQKMFYYETWVNFGFQVLLTLSTQCMGLSFAGLMRKFTIYPERALWPTILPTIALNRALLKPERKELIHGWKISKYNFFWITFIGMFCYFWLPDYLFQALSYFNWMTWIKPDNFNLAMITGSYSGLGLNPITTFDWNLSAYLIKPLATPYVTVLNLYFGAFVGLFVIVGVYYSNYKWTAYLPINSNDIFTNTGEDYDVTQVLTNGLLDNAKYQEYSPPFYSAANIVLYSAFFAVYPMTFVFNTFKEWRILAKGMNMVWDNIKELYHNFNYKYLFTTNPNEYSKFKDPHSKMMRKYKEVPDWYYLIILVLSVIFAILCVKVYPDSNTPVWGIFFVIGINLVFLVQFTLLYAVTGVQLGLNVLVELIVGYALQGNGVALMTLKAYGYNIDGQADSFITSMKIGHYSKIPPRAIFRAQLYGVIIQAFTFLGVVNWSLSNIEDFCSEDQAQHFTCPSERTYYAASVLWGVIGPKVVFNGLYPMMQYSFLFGLGIALLCIAIRVFCNKYNWYKKWFVYVDVTVMMNGILNTYAPYNLGYLTPGLYISWTFMNYIKKKYIAWFEKYNYVLSAGLDAGVAFSAIIIFFAVQYHEKDVTWWGNTVSYAGVDGGVGQTTLYDITQTERGYFGPEKGSYPVA